jgi:hypothetical protein
LIDEIEVDEIKEGIYEIKTTGTRNHRRRLRWPRRRRWPRQAKAAKLAMATEVVVIVITAIKVRVRADESPSMESVLL